MWPFKRKDWRVSSAEPKFAYHMGQPYWCVLLTFMDGRQQYAKYHLGAGVARPYRFETEAEAAKCAQWLLDECDR